MVSSLVLLSLTTVTLAPPPLSTLGPSEANYKYLSALLLASDTSFAALVDPKADAPGDHFQVRPGWWKPILPPGERYPDLGPTLGKPLPVTNSYIEALPTGAWQYVDEMKVGTQIQAEGQAARLKDVFAATFQDWQTTPVGPNDHNVEPLYEWTAKSAQSYTFTIAVAKPEINHGWVVRLELAHNTRA